MAKTNKTPVVSLPSVRALDKIQNRERPRYTQAELKTLIGRAEGEISELQVGLAELRSYANDLGKYSSSAIVCEAISGEAKNVLQSMRAPVAKLQSLFDRKAAKEGQP